MNFTEQTSLVKDGFTAIKHEESRNPRAINERTTLKSGTLAARMSFVPCWICKFTAVSLPCRIYVQKTNAPSHALDPTSWALPCPISPTTGQHISNGRVARTTRTASPPAVGARAPAKPSHIRWVRLPGKVTSDGFRKQPAVETSNPLPPARRQPTRGCDLMLSPCRRLAIGLALVLELGSVSNDTAHAETCAAAPPLDLCKD